ncbi:MAG: HAMP domain-containing protein [Deltaproteobacteria bacterium]|nr:HAMP domain-containing protein [Deltaproteobacteria bacterium]
MRLQSKLVVAFLVVGVLPLGAVAWILTVRMNDAFERSFTARKEQVVEAVQRRIEGVSRDVDTALKRMSEDVLIERELLEPLRRRVFYDGHDDADHEGAITREARRLVTSAAVDTLRIVDLGEKVGHVIAMGHRKGVEPPDEQVVALAGARPNETFFRHERVEDDATGEAVETWTLQRLKVVEDRVVLVGGRVIDRALLDELRVGAGPETQLSLADAHGTRIAATFTGDVPAGDYVKGEQRITAGAGDEELGATLTVYVSRDEVKRLTGELLATAAALASVSGILALLAGLWISRRISKPLASLAEAATAVAAGEREQRVREPRGRDEVARLTRAFNSMTEELSDGEERLRQSERVAAWREIARRIAHEIKNPLFPIQMSIETLKKVWERKHPDFDEIFEESTATILEEVGRMKRIVTEFSNFARMPAPKPQPCDLADVAAQVLVLVRETAPEIELVQAGPAEVEVVVDPDMMRQAMLNLVKNAIEALRGKGDAAPAGARVELRVEEAEDDGVRVVVTDNGPGMDEETRKKLFVPYFTTKAEGTGLGLPMVHRIVAEHGGTLRVDSKPDVGTRFALWLPRELEKRAALDYEDAT